MEFLKRIFGKKDKFSGESNTELTIHNKRGLGYMKEMKLDLAIEEFKKVLDLDPDFVEAYNSLGLCYQGKGELALTIEVNKKALSKDPIYANAHFDLGMAYMEMNPQEAVEYFKTFIDLVPHEGSNAVKITMAKQFLDMVD